MMMSINKAIFDSTSVSDGYAKKTSLDRYKELRRTFPNTLILFRNMGYYYGFDETAVVLDMWFGYTYHKSHGMLVAKGNNYKLILEKFQMCGLRYIVDENGKLTFGKGKGFKLSKPLSYYESHPIVRQPPKNKSTSWTDSYSRHGGGWHDDVWAPGLPSSRFYKSKK